MLNTPKITVTAKSIVNETEIASFGAIFGADESDITFYNKQVDKPACKEHRDIVRADQADFEDYVYSLQEKAKVSE